MVFVELVEGNKQFMFYVDRNNLCFFVDLVEEKKQIYVFCGPWERKEIRELYFLGKEK